MAVVGIDFGTLHSKIGVARHRGIDIIANEVSNRATPSLVAFGPKQRHIGEAAKTQETANFKNTIGSLKRLVGRTLSDPDIQQVESKFINAALVDASGTVGAKVNYLGETHVFTSTQLVAMYLAKLRDIAANELKVGVADVVISVPGWYPDIQRRAVLDAAAIAGLNVLRLINDTTAVALGYGITKSDLPDPDKPRHVVFVDVGHSSLSVAVVAFSKGQLVVKSTAYDRHLGGRDVDYALVKHFAQEFKQKYNIDVLSSPKAVFRLSTGCEKLKKVLSANHEAPLNVESVMNDVDASSKLTREQLESFVADVLDRIPAPLQRALADSGITLEDVDAVELVGGVTRMPAVRDRIKQIFPGKSLSTTLNQDEAVARGATFACAMLSPVFRVRDFHMHDITPYSIKVQWDPAAADPGDDTELIVFPQANSIPSTKVLSFYRKDPFEVEAVYSDPAQLPGAINPWIARFTAKSVPADPKGDMACVKLKTRLNLHGVLSFEGAYVEEIEEREDPPMEVDAAGADAASPPPPPPKKKKHVKKVPIPFITSNTSLDPSLLEKYKEQEAQMHAADKLVMDTENCKNSLEEYVYDMRSKLDERYAQYVQPQEKEKLLTALAEAESWLYSDEGEDAQKSAYVTRLDALKLLGDPITTRYREAEDRPRTTAQLRSTLNEYLSHASSTDDKYSHIDEKDKQSIIERCATITKWLEDQSVRQSERSKNVDPVLTAAEIAKRREEIVHFATPILTKPKPKPPVTPGTQTPKSRTDTPDPGAQAPPPPPPPPHPEGGAKKEEAPGPSQMDVD